MRQGGRCGSGDVVEIFNLEEHRQAGQVMTGESMSGGLGEYGRCGGVCSETVRCGGLRQGGRCGGVVKRDQSRAPPS